MLQHITAQHLAANWLLNHVQATQVKREPDIIGRSRSTPDDDISARSSTRQLVAVGIPFDGAAIGLATVAIFESTGSMDDGGLVIRCNIRNDASAYQVHAVVTTEGADIHIAGDAESLAVLDALHQAVAQAHEIFRHRRQLPTRPHGFGS